MKHNKFVLPNELHLYIFKYNSSRVNRTLHILTKNCNEIYPYVYSVTHRDFCTNDDKFKRYYKYTIRNGYLYNEKNKYAILFAPDLLYSTLFKNNVELSYKLRTFLPFILACTQCSDREIRDISSVFLKGLLNDGLITKVFNDFLIKDINGHKHEGKKKIMLKFMEIFKNSNSGNFIDTGIFHTALKIFWLDINERYIVMRYNDYEDVLTEKMFYKISYIDSDINT